MLTCRTCGAQSTGEFNFCPHCGKRFPMRKKQREEEPDIKKVDPVLTPIEAARFLKISRWMLDELRILGKMPTSCYMVLEGRGTGKRLTYRYFTKELLRWADDQDYELTTAREDITSAG